jgi:O-antigen/teichoic acid export membrane protein
LLLATLILSAQIYHPHTSRFIALAGGVLVGNSISNLVQSLLVVQGRVRLSAVVSMTTGVLLVLCSAAAISNNLPLEILAALLVLASWLQAAILTWSARRYLWPARFRFDLDFCKRQLAAGFPFVPIVLFIALEAQLGGILLSLFHSETAVGYYGMANTIVAGLALFSQAVRIGIFPSMARLHRVEGDHFARLYERAWRYLSIISMPMVAILVLLAEWIILIVYRSSAPEAVMTLQLLAPTLIFYFLNIPNARLMILENRQRTLAYLFAVSGVANVLAGLLLIPAYGTPGVAIARVLSMSILFALSQYYVSKNILATQTWRFVWQPLVATAAMGFVVFVPLAGSSILVRSVIGVAAYGVLLVCLRAIPKEDWHWLRQKLASWDIRSRLRD